MGLLDSYNNAATLQNLTSVRKGRKEIWPFPGVSKAPGPLLPPSIHHRRSNHQGQLSNNHQVIHYYMSCTMLSGDYLMSHCYSTAAMSLKLA